MNSIEDIALGTVCVLIGPNGSGKSRRLRQLCDRALRRGVKVLSVAPTIYDRFVGIRSSNFRFFGARRGRSAATSIIRDALIRASTDKPQILKTLVQILKYTGFDSEIGISIRWADLERFDEAAAEDKEPLGKELGLSFKDLKSLRYSLQAWRRDKIRKDAFFRSETTEWNGEVILKLSMKSFSFSELHGLNYLEALRYESALIGRKIIARPKLYFFCQLPQNRYSFKVEL